MNIIGDWLGKKFGKKETFALGLKLLLLGVITLVVRIPLLFIVNLIVVQSNLEPSLYWVVVTWFLAVFIAIFINGWIAHKLWKWR